MRSFRVPFVVLACAAGSYAQSVMGFGAITGTVTDAYGEGMPDAIVAVLNESFGIHRVVHSTDDGLFDVPALTPGPGYSIKVTRKSFTAVELKNIEVHVGRTLNYRIPMAAVNTKMPSDEPVPLRPLDDNHGTRTASFDRREAYSFPLDGFRVEELAWLGPAVSENPANGALTSRGGPFDHAVDVDGVNVTNTYFFPTKPDLVPMISANALEDVEVLPGGGPGEFGRFNGTPVNAATQSGTSTVHGQLYDYHTDRSLISADRYAAGHNLSVSQNQPGGNLGGAVIPEKFFVFGNVEGILNSEQELNRLVNPLITEPDGNSVNPNNCKAVTAQCTAVTNYIKSQLNLVVPTTTHTLRGVVKGDLRESDRSNWTFEIAALHSHAPASNAVVSTNNQLGAYGGTSDDESRMAKAEWLRQLSPGIFNDMRLSAFKDRIGMNPNSKYWPSTGAVDVNVAGTPLGANGLYTENVGDYRYQFADNFTITSNSHTFKFGGDLFYGGDWLYGVANAAGAYVYPSLTAFATDFSSNSSSAKNYTSYTQGFGNPIRDLADIYYSGYGQDTWKATPKLTMTVGVRYEKWHLPKPQFVNTSFYETDTINSPGLDIAPRVGIAYMLREHTVVRLGYGFYYAPFNGSVVDPLYLGNGIAQENITVVPYSTQSGATVFPKKISAVGNIPNGTEDVEYANSKFRNPYSSLGSFSVEHRFDSGIVFTFDYLYNRGEKLWTANDGNIGPTGLAATSSTNGADKTYTVYNSSGTVQQDFTTWIYYQKTSVTYGKVIQAQNAGASWYNGLALELKRPFTRTLSAALTYTWSHALDDVNGPTQFGFPTNLTDAAYIDDRGSSATDQRQRGVLRWIWEPASQNPLLRDWQLSAIATAASGLPLTPTLLVIGQQWSGFTMDYTNSLNGTGGWDRVPFEGVGFIHTQTMTDLDARLTRTFRIGERAKAQIAAEAFNALNRQWNTSMYTTQYVSTTGSLRPVTGFEQGQASYGFPFGTNARRAQVSFRVIF
ncbi:MAG: carboxypeptidase regulatory-like domain-containing protein [Bryobacteraceae bacterium]|jgi:outer membrane receptor protein involved in Fe transport